MFYKVFYDFTEENLVRAPIDRTNDTKQAGETYRKFEKWEQDDRILNLTTDLAKCASVIQETMKVKKQIIYNEKQIRVIELTLKCEPLL